MGSVKQWQRRAIERLYPYTREYTVVKARHNILVPDNLSLYWYGVSYGIGTCSDIMGMQVLVGGLAPSKKNLPAQAIAQCRYAVIVRPATAREYKMQRASFDQMLMTVELLIPAGVNHRSVMFRLSSHRSYYIRIV